MIKTKKKKENKVDYRKVFDENMGHPLKQFQKIIKNLKVK